MPGDLPRNPNVLTLPVPPSSMWTPLAPQTPPSASTSPSKRPASRSRDCPLPSPTRCPSNYWGTKPRGERDLQLSVVLPADIANAPFRLFFHFPPPSTISFAHFSPNSFDSLLPVPDPLHSDSSLPSIPSLPSVPLCPQLVGHHLPVGGPQNSTVRTYERSILPV